ncbi:hypothetical protein [Shewanella sp.]
MKLEGIGPITATAMIASVGDFSDSHCLTLNRYAAQEAIWW